MKPTLGECSGIFVVCIFKVSRRLPMPFNFSARPRDFDSLTRWTCMHFLSLQVYPSGLDHQKQLTFFMAPSESIT